MITNIEKLHKYQIVMSWIILEYNVCYFIDSDFAGRYKINNTWYKHRRIIDPLYDQRWELFKNLSLFLGKDIQNEVSFNPSRPSAKIVLEKFENEATNILIWPEDVEELFEELITSEKIA